jgi:hypothetical protein
VELGESANSGSMSVYTTGFRLVRKVELGAMPAGSSAISIDGARFEGLTTGNYLYVVESRLSNGRKVRSKIRVLVIIRRN